MMSRKESTKQHGVRGVNVVSIEVIIYYHWIWRIVRNRIEGKGKEGSGLGFCPEEEDAVWLNKISSTEMLTDSGEIMCCYEGGKNTIHKFHRYLYTNNPLASA